jgi:hypothetical protein
LGGVETKGGGRDQANAAMKQTTAAEAQAEAANQQVNAAKQQIENLASNRTRSESSQRQRCGTASFSHAALVLSFRSTQARLKAAFKIVRMRFADACVKKSNRPERRKDHTRNARWP